MRKYFQRIIELIWVFVVFLIVAVLDLIVPLERREYENASRIMAVS